MAGQISPYCIVQFLGSSSYSFDETKNMITLEYNSNFSHKGIIKTLIPWSRSPDKKTHLEKLFNVFIDGKKIKSDFNSRRLEILYMEPGK